ncbi:uncharacterized protein LOC120429037 [Culex pipiens pallens]|uniref:uncharacterized protein LOC120429037 n=1 Tax=Culex pipiens pallens TaxID=42434 RepID=UPI001953F205|nr:uncharacterized protein LOC120429037 [Culex pipiens pallens]
MQTKFRLCHLWLTVILLVRFSRAGTIEISAYSKNGNTTSSLSIDQGTGRAGTGTGGSYSYPFQNMLSKPVAYRTSSYQDYSYKSPKYIVYPSNSQSVDANGQGSTKNDVAMDRFAPGEAYGGTIYKIMKAKQKGYQYLKPKDSALDDSSTASPPSGPAAPSATTVQALPPPITPPPLPPVIVAPTPVPATNAPSYIPPAPSDLNKFPPNSDSNWPTHMDSPSYNSPITSYLGPDPSKPPKGSYYAPPNYLPPPTDGQFRFSGDSSYLPPPAGPADSPDSGPPSDSDDMVGTISVGPNHPQYLPPQASPQQQYLPPDNPPPMMMPQPMPPMGMMDMPKEMGGWMGGPPEHSFPDFSQFEHDHDHYYPHDHYPEYVFDPHHDETTTTTAAPPPPPEPGTARVKNYSYYYISRTLWYVPLYFTLYFCFYVLVLILRSIARHKVNIPNQWVGRSSLEAMPTLTNAQIAEKTDMLTHFVLKQIDDFKGKYIG